MAVVISSPTGAKSRGVVVPDSKLAREVTELVRDTEPPLLFYHSSRVYYWGALTGKRRGLRFDPRAALRRRHVPRHRPLARACERA